MPNCFLSFTIVPPITIGKTTMKKLLAVSSLAVLLSGCNATPYKSGYSETQLNHGVYKITARVDGFSLSS